MSDDIETKFAALMAKMDEVVEELRAQRTPKRATVSGETRKVRTDADADELVARTLKKLGSAA